MKIEGFYWITLLFGEFLLIKIYWLYDTGGSSYFLLSVEFYFIVDLFIIFDDVFYGLLICCSGNS